MPAPDLASDTELAPPLEMSPEIVVLPDPAIISVLVTIEQANRQAQTATASISTLSAANQTNLLAILAPVQLAISNSVANGTVGIKDPATQQKVQLGLVTIQTVINTGVAFIKAAKTA